MKLPNGYGGITKLSGNRRKPFMAYKTIGYTDNGTQIKKPIGYGINRAAALSILAEYNTDPYELTNKNITFKEIWENDALIVIEKKYNNQQISYSNFRNLKSYYKNYCKVFHNLPILSIKKKTIQNEFDKMEIGKSAKGFVKTVCLMIFESAIDTYELPLKRNPALEIRIGSNEKSNKHIIIPQKIIDELWLNKSNEIIKIVLILLYSGLRPTELFLIKNEFVHLKDNNMIGGIKTKAGKERVIPIHSKIKSLIEYFYDTNNEYLINLDFMQNKDRSNEKIMRSIYTIFSSKFEKIHVLNIYTPYDCRHTFITKLKKVEENEYLIKLIVGHKIKDLTERVYTHRTIFELVESINKIH